MVKKAVAAYQKKAHKYSEPARKENKKPQSERKTIHAYKGADLFENDMKEKYGKDFYKKLNKKESDTYSKLLD